MTGWRDARPKLRRISPLGWGLALLRLSTFAIVTYGGLILLLVLRLMERPLCGLSRPVTPYVTQGVCKAGLVVLGLRLCQTGQPMTARGAVVANHTSWLDIFVLNACDRVYFVSKAEVARWPGIGWLARATGTLFIARNGAEAKVQQQQFETRLRAGHRLLFFPEGTSTDGLRVLPFKSTLFAAFFTHGMNHVMHIQPVTVSYIAPKDEDARFYGWWGEMDFGRHLIRVLATPKWGRVDVTYHPPVRVDDHADRKALAADLERTIRQGHNAGAQA